MKRTRYSNSGLTFNTTCTQYGNKLELRTCYGEEIFSIPYHDDGMLEGFMILVEEIVSLITTESSENSERINRLWCYEIRGDPNSSDERVTELA